jgi:hypothetical protein
LAPAPSFSQPAHPSTPTPQSTGNNLGGLIGTLAGGLMNSGGPQSTASSSNPYQGASRPLGGGYQPTLGQLAPGAPGAPALGEYAQDAFSAAQPQTKTISVPNPAYASWVDRTEAAAKTYDPNMVDVPSLAGNFNIPTFDSMQPQSLQVAPAKAPPKTIQKTITVPAAPARPFTPTPVSAYTPTFAPNTPVYDANQQQVGTISGRTLQAQPLSLGTRLANALGFGGTSNGAGLVGGVPAGMSQPGGFSPWGNVNAGNWGASGNGSMGGGYRTSNEGGNLHG